jgi:hypothetical protein
MLTFSLDEVLEHQGFRYLFGLLDLDDFFLFEFLESTSELKKAIFL